jgi:MFS family permease
MTEPGERRPSGSWKRFRILAPLAQRDFRLLWYGLVISLIGDGIFLVAVAWQAYAVDNHPSALAAVGVSVAAPQLILLLVGGALSDRLPRRVILVVSDLARGAALALLSLQGWTGHIRLWHLCAAGAVIGAGTAFAAPAFDAIVPELVSEHDLQQANGLDQFLRPVTLRLLGPALGGFLVAAVGASSAFAVDACSFLVSAWCVSRITPFIKSAAAKSAVAESAAAAEPPSLWTDLREGVHYVRAHVWLWGSFGAASFTYLLCFGPIDVLLPFVVRNQLHGSATSLGLILGTGGVGALAAAAVVGQQDRVERPMTFIYVCWAGAALLVAGYGVATAQWELAVAAFALNVLEAAGAVVWSTMKQRNVPIDLLGRVSSIDWFVSTGLTPLSYALTPLAASLLGVRTTLVVAGVAGSAITAAFLFLPGMRVHDRLPAAVAAAAPIIP